LGVKNRDAKIVKFSKKNNSGGGRHWGLPRKKWGGRKTLNKYTNKRKPRWKGKNQGKKAVVKGRGQTNQVKCQKIRRE